MIEKAERNRKGLEERGRENKPQKNKERATKKQLANHAAKTT